MKLYNVSDDKELSKAQREKINKEYIKIVDFSVFTAKCMEEVNSITRVRPVHTVFILDSLGRVIIYTIVSEYSEKPKE